MTNQTKYHFFVDATKYETDKANLTGAQIKAMVPGFNPAYQLYLEEHGDTPDKAISDGETVSLDPAGHGIRKFYSVPPATFGAS
jgi:Multiubiquitin